MRRSDFAVRLQPSLPEELRKGAGVEGVAVSRLINVAVAERSTPRKISRAHGGPHLLNFIHDEATLRYRTTFSARPSARVTQMPLRKVA
jgi:hypothetical protein